jgi:hypothetical protein
MSSLSQWGALTVLCLLPTQQGLAQPAVCGGDYVCMADAPAAVMIWSEKRGPELRDRSPSDPAALTGLHRCPDGPVDVTAATDGERQLACSAASDALRLLGRCGIWLRRPLHVEIRSEVRHPFNGAILGLLDVKQERVLIAREANVPALVKDTPVAKLPLRDFYRSLIVHEVVHGVMHQNLKRRWVSHAAAEYPAYALQVESLPPDVRNRFLQSFGQATVKADASLFHDVGLFVDPFLFATRAYEHLNAAGNGCAHLQALLDGEARFIATLPAGW